MFLSCLCPLCAAGRLQRVFASVSASECEGDLDEDRANDEEHDDRQRDDVYRAKHDEDAHDEPDKTATASRGDQGSGVAAPS